MESIVHLIKSHLDVSEDALSEIAKRFVKRKLPRKAQILIPNDRQQTLIFLVKGVTRNFYRLDRKEWTSRFSQAGDLVLSIDSFLFDEPSKEYIECCTPIEFWEISKNDYHELLSKYTELQILACKLSYRNLRLSTTRMYNWKMLTSVERYGQFCKENPSLIKTVQGQHIASYLGISAFDLSRIRRRFSQIKVSTLIFHLVPPLEIW
ncbi:cAMP-binding domain of CRP or a regulatory subunit of cAMP-dependent protein kinases [Dyadobacter sp. SG02]|nr:cAMP-binding domain of CRP or a regulatory subunit of cAMP-dependent protein kinases [Dyadobacter sp. SG02]